jgi:GT2 family glycosyltransferase
VKPTLCVINFNGTKILTAALDVAVAIADRFESIIVVDDCSTDGSVEFIESRYPSVRIIRQARNQGPGAARNAGMRQAGSDVVIVMDNDVALTAGCVDHLVAALANNPKAVVAAPAVLYAHKRDTIQYDGAECHFLGVQTLLDEDRLIADVDPVVRKVGSLVSCCFAIDRSRLAELELFDESYFIYFEDHDYGWRLRALGAEVLSVPQAQCFHGVGTEGLSIRQLGTYSSRRVFYLIRNRWLCVLKNFSLRTMVVMLPLLLVYECAQFAIVIKKGWLPEWWRSLTWVISHFPAVRRELRRIQHLRKLPDRQLLVGGPVPFRSELSTGVGELAARRILDVVVQSYWKVASALI